MEKASSPAPAPPDERLESWKEIGRYLDRDVRTVERWERTKGLPVRRLPGGDKARVYALRSELDAWLSSRHFHFKETAQKPSPPPSIAVLPFANLSADRENEYFGDGLAEDIIDALTKLPGLRVIARISAFSFRAKNLSAREIGARLKVETVLEGSVRKEGSRVRVAAQLIQTADQSHLWSERYDREMTGVFAIQDEISRAIVEKLRVPLAGEHPLVKRQTENLEAYNLFLRGRHCIQRLTPESLAKGKEYLQQAIALDPNYALPYTGLAEYYWVSAFWCYVAGGEALSRAKEAALAAVRLDDTLAEAHAWLGTAKGMVDFDWVGAEEEFRRALELNPASPLVHFYYAAYCLQPMGQTEKELPEARRAVELDPLSVRANAYLGFLYGRMRQYDLALTHGRIALDLDPSAYMPRMMIAHTYNCMGRFEEGIAEAKRANDLTGGNVRTLLVLIFTYTWAGQRAEARSLWKELTARRRTTHVPPGALAAACAALGKVGPAVKWLEKALEERDPAVIYGLKFEPWYACLHEHPRYKALLRKMNLGD